MVNNYFYLIIIAELILILLELSCHLREGEQKVDGLSYGLGFLGFYTTGPGYALFLFF